jgi:hypothetical protein
LGAESVKMTKAKQYNAQRKAHIKILDENEFVNMTATGDTVIEIIKPAEQKSEKVLDKEGYKNFIERVINGQNNRIETKTGKMLQYKVEKKEILINNSSKWVVKLTELETAYHIWPVEKTSEFAAAGLESSGSYLWALLNKFFLE